MALLNRLPCKLINIQSIGNKTNKIRNLIVDQNLDICMMTETWLSGNVSDNSKINEMTPKSHKFFHIPRINKRGGGVGILVKKIYKVTIMNQIEYCSFKNISVSLTLKPGIDKNVQLSQL